MSNKSTIVRFINVAANTVSVVAPATAARWLERLFLTPRAYKQPDREVQWLKAMRRDSLDFGDGRRMPIWTAGPEDGATVLLVHGWSGRGSQLGAMIAPLVQDGYKVITYDGPAHGMADGKRSGLPEMAVALERIADHIGPIDSIIAHSMGAAITTVAVARGLKVNRLVYIASPENPRRYLDMAGNWLGFSRKVIDRTQKLIETRFDLPMDQVRGAPLARRIDTPLLIIHDLDDQEVPISEGERLQHYWKGARLIATRLLGHYRILRDTAVIEATIGFINNRDDQDQAAA